MIYFDNAATGGFKPYAVHSATETTMKYLLANPSRSAHRRAIAGAEIVYNCRKILADEFNSTPEKCIFTKNCTEALNTAIFGSLKKGGHVITTIFEHNSVLRPLNYLKNQGLIDLDIVSNSENGLVSNIKNSIKKNTYLIVMTAVSNVTGEKLPFSEVGKVAKDNNLLFLLDGAQAGGHFKIDLKTDNVSYLALAGHKGLFAPMGTGALIIDKDKDLSPLTFGGTGTESSNLFQPECYPERLESGTLNLPAIAGFSEGAKYAFDNRETFSKTLLSYTQKLINGLNSINNVKVFSSPNPSGIVSFLVENYSSSEVADILNSEYDIAVRAGLHCAPLIHKHLKTHNEGLVRASLSVQNTLSEIAYFLRSVKKIANN